MCVKFDILAVFVKFNALLWVKFAICLFWIFGRKCKFNALMWVKFDDLTCFSEI